MKRAAVRPVSEGVDAVAAGMQAGGGGSLLLQCLLALLLPVSGVLTDLMCIPWLVLGFSFDLTPLTKKNGAYKVGTEKYDFYINVCGPVSVQPCQPNSGACQVAKRQVISRSGFVLWYFVLVSV